MNKKDKKELLKRYLAGECSAEEVSQVEQWYALLKTNNDKSDDTAVEKDIEEVRQILSRAIRRKKTKTLYRSIAAAIVFCTLSLGGYFYYTTISPEQIDSSLTNNTIQIKGIEPGKNVAILQLEDGTEIELDDDSQSVIAHTGGSTAYLNEEGQLHYKMNDPIGEEARKPVTNTVRTPRGGQFQITLPDGSQVWLNAASQLTYTIGENAGERFVELDGEAYFEIAKDKNRPFKVHSNGQVIEVLGTHFNVNSYVDEPGTKTTLLEGSVKITETNNGKDVILQPGQQAVLQKNRKLKVNRINTEEAVAWKNGKFNFNNADIHDVARQLARWYNVEVVFEGRPADVKLSGEVHRNTRASKVLEILSFYDLNCTIETVNGVQQITIE